MSVEKENVGNGILWTFAALCCAVFRTPSFRKSLKFFGTSIASLDPETVQLPAFYKLSAMLTGAPDSPEAKPRSGATLVRYAHDCGTRLFVSTGNSDSITLKTLNNSEEKKFRMRNLLSKVKARLHWRFLRRSVVAISRRFQIARVNYWRFRGDLNRQWFRRATWNRAWNRSKNRTGLYTYSDILNIWKIHKFLLITRLMNLLSSRSVRYVYSTRQKMKCLRTAIALFLIVCINITVYVYSQGRLSSLLTTKTTVASRQGVRAV